MKTCLIVDDSKVVRKVARSIFEDLGFECREAENGQQACDDCLTAMPEVILLDWNMPVMNGIEFLRKLRGMTGGSTPKVIFCTTENEMSFIQQALEAGADEYIMKPFDRCIVQGKLSQIEVL